MKKEINQTLMSSSFGVALESKATDVNPKKKSESTDTTFMSCVVEPVLAAGGAATIGSVVGSAQTSSENLGQKYKETYTYQSINEEGESTGVGYAFEDLCADYYRKHGNSIQKVDAYNNGPDYIIDGTPTQMKCCTTAEQSAKALYNESGCRYAGQDVVVPEGQRDVVERYCQQMEQQGYGRPRNIKEAPISRETAMKYSQRGWNSFMMDAKNFKILGPSVGGGVLIGFVGYGVETALKGELNRKDKAKKVAKWMGMGLLYSAVSLGIKCGIRQQFRNPSVTFRP